MQSNRARIAVGVAALAAIVVLFVVFSDGGDDETTSTPVAEQTTATEAEEDADGGGSGSERPERPEGPTYEQLVVAGGEPKGGAKQLSYERGERVRLEVRSDVDEEIHVHGYDIYEQLRAGKTTRFSFPAEIDGVFEIELHGSGAELARLTVRP